ncbi:MAG: hypothetical protein QMD65_00605 [Patescibacteria group bacterium]|nr:hypothetical protein [Patescibacteria group bacterium]
MSLEGGGAYVSSPSFMTIPNTWSRVFLDLTQMNPNSDPFNRIVIQTGGTSDFFVDDVRLIGRTQ